MESLDSEGGMMYAWEVLEELGTARTIWCEPSPAISLPSTSMKSWVFEETEELSNSSFKVMPVSGSR